MMYNAKSSVAQEFINHEEILSTIEYAKKNKPHNLNKKLINISLSRKPD